MGISLDEFLRMPQEEIVRLVGNQGPQVVVFPINGTRRWFLLEHPPQDSASYWDEYMQIASRRHVELYQMFFDHGISTLLNPIFGPDILERGDAYMQMAAPGMAMMCQHPIFRDFYDRCEVRVRFYGEYRRYLNPTPYAYLSDAFDQIAEETRHHTRHRLYYGVCANDATVSVVEFAIRYYQEHGHPPDKQTIIEMYYGESLPPVGLFIGMDQFAAYDMPLLTTGEEDLYFMVNPSPYLTSVQLRGILWDHLYARRDDDQVDYSAYQAADWEALRAFCQANQGMTLGVGTRHPKLGLWYPLPQVQLTPDWDIQRS